MTNAHEWVGVAAIAVCGLAAIWGFVAARRGLEPGPVLRQLLALSQTVVIAQVALGLLLLSDDQRAAHDLHYAYGTFALLAVLSPWFYAPGEPRRRLLWFAAASLVAGALAVRAYMEA